MTLIPEIKSNRQKALNLADVSTSLATFLSDPNPSVIALVGKWGRGKSFFWHQFLRDNVQATDDRLYSYISLFGQGDLQALKDSVFDNAIPIREVNHSASISQPPMLSRQGLAERAKAVGWNLKKLSRIVDKVPHLAELAPFARALAFLSVRNYIVCIDDLERRGKDLGIRDVLGLATLLKDQNACRVIVILNSDALEDDHEEYDRLREKVFDYEIVFEPVAAECAAIAFPAEYPYSEEARRHAVALNITNIRVLFRIRRLLDAILTAADGASEIIRQQLVHSAVLLGWCYNTKDGSAPDYQYVRSLSFARIVSRALGEETSEVNKRWSATLEAYEYLNTDELDLAICDTLERGFADTRVLKLALADKEGAKRRSKLEQEYHDAWQIFHEGFGDDAARLAAAFEASFRNGANLISPMNASSSIQLLRQLGKEDLADELSAVWIDINKTQNAQALNLDVNPWRDEIGDKKFRDAIDAAWADLRPALPTLSEVASGLAAKNGWSEDDVSVLSAASVEDFYDLFRSLRGHNARGIVQSCLRFADVGGNPAYQVIGSRVREALKRIADESPLNADRVRSLARID
jgi:hypothetical protein